MCGWKNSRMTRRSLCRSGFWRGAVSEKGLNSHFVFRERESRISAVCAARARRRRSHSLPVAFAWVLKIDGWMPCCGLLLYVTHIRGAAVAAAVGIEQPAHPSITYTSARIPIQNFIHVPRLA
jgi:hypothetical protein